jgi:hypothetical protein
VSIAFLVGEALSRRKMSFGAHCLGFDRSRSPRLYQDRAKRVKKQWFTPDSPAFLASFAARRGKIAKQTPFGTF